MFRWVVLSVIISYAAAHYVCPGDYEAIEGGEEGVCYQLIDEKQMPFPAAMLTCSDAMGTLFRPRDRDTMEAVIEHYDMPDIIPGVWLGYARSPAPLEEDGTLSPENMDLRSSGRYFYDLYEDCPRYEMDVSMWRVNPGNQPGDFALKWDENCVARKRAGRAMDGVDSYECNNPKRKHFVICQRCAEEEADLHFHLHLRLPGGSQFPGRALVNIHTDNALAYSDNYDDDEFLAFVVESTELSIDVYVVDEDEDDTHEHFNIIGYAVTIVHEGDVYITIFPTEQATHVSIEWYDQENRDLDLHAYIYNHQSGQEDVVYFAHKIGPFGVELDTDTTSANGPPEIISLASNPDVDVLIYVEVWCCQTLDQSQFLLTLHLQNGDTITYDQNDMNFAADDARVLFIILNGGEEVHLINEPFVHTGSHVNEAPFYQAYMNDPNFPTGTVIYS